MVCTLALISAIAPLSIDMYLPALPSMAEAMGASTASVQLTLTTFMVGLGVGQLVVGPISDGIGRRKMMVVAAVIMTLSSVACAIAPSIGFLVAARLVQGLSGGSAIVLARACISDRARGDNAAKLFSLMMIIGSIAPVVAPLIGGVLLGPLGWRGIFFVLSVAGMVMVCGATFFVPETLTLERRHSGGLRAMSSHVRIVACNRRYVGYACSFIFGFGALFAYISASPFVIQNVLAFTPSQFSAIFAANAAGMVTTAMLAARLVERVGARVLLRFGIKMLVISGVVLLCTSALPAPVGSGLILVPLFLAVSSVGFILGNATALAQNEVVNSAGTGSALLGAGQFGLAAIVSPLVGIAGDHNAVPMAIAIPIFGLLAAGALALLAGGEGSVG
ncbi:multidrug effflux MFS transporter [Rhodococcus sp. 27YEA15]|uniref:multidrug effflux MFS transporter n=1 Tax=Rhodococcus sp. 27YEA15 TaxID=3156259 RepID=UPI003C7E8C8D